MVLSFYLGTAWDLNLAESRNNCCGLFPLEAEVITANPLGANELVFSSSVICDSKMRIGAAAIYDNWYRIAWLSNVKRI